MKVTHENVHVKVILITHYIHQLTQSIRGMALSIGIFKGLLQKMGSLTNRDLSFLFFLDLIRKLLLMKNTTCDIAFCVN
jgi:hypothetical protein